MTNKFFKTVEDDLKEVAAYFTGGVEAEAMAFFDALAESIYANGGKVLIDAAKSAVASAEAAGGDAATKLAAAVASVTGVLTSEGVPVVLNAIHGAIEAAVAALHAANAPVTAA